MIQNAFKMVACIISPMALNPIGNNGLKAQANNSLFRVGLYMQLHNICDVIASFKNQVSMTTNKRQLQSSLHTYSWDANDH